MPIAIPAQPFPTFPDANARIIHNNATLTANGSDVSSDYGNSILYLVINVKNAPTGTAPTLQFIVEEVDPVDQQTVLASYSSTVVTAQGIQSVEIPASRTGCLKVRWVLGGAIPSFSGVNVTLVPRVAGNAVEGQDTAGTTVMGSPLVIAGVDGGDIVRYLKLDASGQLSVVITQVPAGSLTEIAFGFVIPGSTAILPIRSTTYTEQTANAQRSLLSSSGLDTAAGTRARKVQITYYDATLTGPFTETITLNGTTPVNTVASNICFVERMSVTEVGTKYSSNAGTISLRATVGGGGATIGSIAIAENSTRWAHHYVPVGKTAEIKTLTIGTRSNNGGGFWLMRSNPLSAVSPEYQIGPTLRTAQNTPHTIYSFVNAIFVPGPARLVMVLQSDSGASQNQFYGSFDFVEVDT